MGFLGEYVIPFKGLSAGTYHYNFVVGQEFFENMDYSEVTDGNLDIDLHLVREENMLTLDFSIQGYVEVPCDRCNELYNQTVSGKERLIVKIGVHNNDENDDVVYLDNSVHQIDLSHHIFEFIHLLLPLRRVHMTDENGNSQCNQKTLSVLNTLSGEHMADPRFEILKDLKSKLE